MSTRGTFILKILKTPVFHHKKSKLKNRKKTFLIRWNSYQLFSLFTVPFVILQFPYPIFALINSSTHRKVIRPVAISQH